MSARVPGKGACVFPGGRFLEDVLGKGEWPGCERVGRERFCSWPWTCQAWCVLCMYVCVCVLHAHLHVCTHLCVHVCVCTCIYVREYVCTC